MKISILGGTGFVGSHIAEQAVKAGNEVTIIARKRPSSSLTGAEYRLGDISDNEASISELFSGAQVVISALSPRASMEGKVLPAVRSIAAWAAQAKVRLIVMGGFSSLRTKEAGPRVAEVGKFPDWLEAEAKEMASIVDWLETSAPQGLNWLYVSPGLGFGEQNTDEPSGAYAILGNVYTDELKGSETVVDDLALGIVDELSKHEHSGHITIISA